MESNTDWRKGKKGMYLHITNRRKIPMRRKGKFCYAKNNKENISCPGTVALNPYWTNIEQPQMEVVSANSPLRTISQNVSPTLLSCNQITVQVEVHEEPRSKNKVIEKKDNCVLITEIQTDLDSIEYDVVPASETPDLGTQMEVTSPTEFNRSSDSNDTSDLIIENVNNEICVNSILEGNRIVNIAYLFQQIRNISHDPFPCNFQHLEFVKEVRIGFQSHYIFKCKLCNRIEKIFSQKENTISKDVPINLNIIQGISQTGNGWTQLDEICSSINMPNMSEAFYIKNNKKLGKVQKDVALQLMLEAGAEERRLALENNDVDRQGTPCITVVTDGSWAKRSYGTNFNSLSGVGCIIGYRTKKVLYIGVKNAYCCVCTVAQNKKEAIPTHQCFKNWCGPSTEMETAAIVDGFKASLSMHSLKYTKIIGDGDSSVVNALRDKMIYGPDVHIRKIECSNHLLRNYSNKLRKISKKTENKNGFVPVILRKALSDRMRRLRNAVTGAITHARKLEISFEDKLRILKKDLRNGPCHVFGWHDSCDTYYCKGRIQEENLVPKLKSCGMWNEIFENLGWLLQNSESLLMQETNNPAEQFNSVIAKFLAGKRVNFTLRGTYEARCFSAVGNYNKKDYSFTDMIQKVICPTENNTYTEKYIEKKKMKLETERKRRATEKARGVKRAKRFKLADRHYGEVEAEADMPPDIFDKKKNDFLLSLKLSAEEIIDLEKKTIAQASSDLWIVERKKRITASMFGQICKMKDKTPCNATLKNMLYSTFTGNDATRYGKAHEATAIAALEKLLKKNITSCGLFVSDEAPYLGATPDGLLGNDIIIEIKCPSSAAAVTPIEAIRLKKISFCTETADSRIKLKKTHNYYYQVQGQLMITNRKYCYFVVWTPNGLNYDLIERDFTFWTREKMNKLENFYYKCVLPELIDPRFPRKLPFRDRF